MHCKTFIMLFAALAAASPAPLNQAGPAHKRGLMLQRDDDLLDEDVPQACRQACEPLLSIARQCRTQFPDQDDDDDNNDDHDRQRRNCVCSAQGASVQAPQCLACIRALPQSQRDDDDDDDVEEIVRACNFQQVVSATGSTASARPAATTAAPGPAVVVCENDDDGDDDCRTFPGSTVPATFRCEEDDGCRTSFIAAGVAVPTGTVGGSSSQTTAAPATTSAPAAGLTIVCENDNDNDRDDDRDDCTTFTGTTVPSTFRCDDDDGCRTSFIAAGAAVPTTLPNTRTGGSTSQSTTSSGSPTPTAGGVTQATPGNAAGRMAVSGVGALAVAGLALVL